MSDPKIAENSAPVIETTITRAIIEGFSEKLLNHLSLDVAIVGAGPSALVAARYLAKAGLKAAIFERKLDRKSVV